MAIFCLGYATSGLRKLEWTDPGAPISRIAFQSTQEIGTTPDVVYSIEFSSVAAMELSLS